jgi:hypothetical protein
MLWLQSKADIGEIRNSPADKQFHRSSGDSIVVKAYVETAVDAIDGIQLGIHDHHASGKEPIALGGFYESGAARVRPL